MNKFIGGDILYWFDQLPNFDISDIYDTEFIKDINDSTHFNIDSKKKIERTDTCIKSTYSNISISSSNLPKLGEPPEGLKIKSGIDTNISIISSDSKDTSSSESDNDSDSEPESNNDSDSDNIQQINDTLSSIKGKVLKEGKDDLDKSQDSDISTNKKDYQKLVDDKFFDDLELKDSESESQSQDNSNDSDNDDKKYSFFDQLELESSDESDSSDESVKKDSILYETPELPTRKDVKLSQLGKSIKGKDNYLAIKQTGKINVK